MLSSKVRHFERNSQTGERINGGAGQRASGSTEERVNRGAGQRASGSTEERVNGRADQRRSGSTEERVNGGAGQWASGSTEERVNTGPCHERDSSDPAIQPRSRITHTCMFQRVVKENATTSPQSRQNSRPADLFGYAHCWDCCIHNPGATEGRDRIRHRHHRRRLPEHFR